MYYFLAYSIVYGSIMKMKLQKTKRGSKFGLKRGTMKEQNKVKYSRKDKHKKVDLTYEID